MLQSILVCDQDPCNKKYLLLLQRRRLQGLESFEGLQVFVGLGGLVLFLVVARVPTCCWIFWIHLRSWAFTSVVAFIVAVYYSTDLTDGALYWPSTKAWTPTRNSSLILSNVCWVQLPSDLLDGTLYYKEIPHELFLRYYEWLWGGF